MISMTLMTFMKLMIWMILMIYDDVWRCMMIFDAADDTAHDDDGSLFPL